MGKIDLETAKIVSDQVSGLMEQADLTLEGLAEATGLSAYTIYRILKMRTNIAPKSANKIASLFALPVEKIFSKELVKLGKLKDIEPLHAFHMANANNPAYFRSRAKENKVATFIREVLIKDPFLNEGRRAAQTAKYISERYKKDFDKKVVAKALERAFEAKILKREDKTGEQSVYYYSLVVPMKNT